MFGQCRGVELWSEWLTDGHGQGWVSVVQVYTWVTVVVVDMVEGIPDGEGDKKT